MSTFRHGLVIGRFYPPHAGHHFLIRSAAEVCERVTVVVMAAAGESIPLGVRVGWIRREHGDGRGARWIGAGAGADDGRGAVEVVGTMDNLEADFDSESAWPGHVELMREAVATGAHGGVRVDAVFTSETYGAELARHFDAADVRLDVPRATYALSSTKIRTDPIAAWGVLEPPVRGWFTKRVVVVGAESTGTTTLSLDLADTLRARGGPYALTRWVGEYGRELTVRKLAVARALAELRGLDQPTIFDLEWEDADFEAVAIRQCADEDAAAEVGGPVLVCDTDALATTVLQERYRGRTTDVVWEVAQAMPPRALYILTDHVGVGFANDGLRDGQYLRPWMTDRFREVLTGIGAQWIEVRGNRAERLEQASAAVDGVLAEGWGLGA